jgi:hypothetical protein
MFPEDYQTDPYREGYPSAERDHEDEAASAAMLLLAEALHGKRADDPDYEAYYRGRIDYCRGVLRAC